MTQVVYPKVAWLTLTHNCNFMCSWCYAKKYCHGNGFMNLEAAKETIKVLAANNTKKIILIGGEPTLYPELRNIVAYIKHMKLHCGLVTNGVALSDKGLASDIVSLGVSTCNISIKGTSEKKYIYNTGKSGLMRAIEGYKNMLECGCETVLSYVVSKPNTEELSELLVLIKKNNIRKISFQMDKPSVLSSSEDNVSIYDLATCCSSIYQIFENEDIDYKIQLSIPFCVIDNQVLEELIKKQRVYSSCHITKGTGIVFDAELNILPCNHFLGMSMNTEPILPQNIIEFWNSRDVTEFRKRINTYPSNKCMNCNYWMSCGGGCFLRWMVFNPQEIIPGING